MVKTNRIAKFKARIEEDGLLFCLELFETATIRLMAHKYAYYVCSNPYLDDNAYDLEEKGWYAMGVALGLLKEDEISPCVDFDPNHGYADKGIELAKSLMKTWLFGTLPG